MKNNHLIRIAALFLALVCVVGVLPLSVFAADGLSDAPATITQKSCKIMTIGGRMVHYESASSVINNEGLPDVFEEYMNVPGYGTARALCVYYHGRLSYLGNGHKWNFEREVSDATLKAVLTYVYSHTNGDFTDAGDAAGLNRWGEGWSNLWFITAQGLSWYYEYGILKDLTSDREGAIEQIAEEFLAAMKHCHDVYNWAHWITDWDNVGIYTVIDSDDGGATGNTSYDFAATAVNSVLNHPEYYHNYHLWLYKWDTSQTWPYENPGVMQDLLIAIPDPEDDDDLPVSLTVKKVEAGTNRPISGVTFKVESADGSGDFSVTRRTGQDGTFTLTSGADGLSAGQYRITETAAPEGYLALTASQLVTVLPGSTADSTVTFYNEEEITGDGTIRKVDADNPTVGIPGAVIRITGVKLDDGGSFTGTYTTGDGGYISKDDLDFTTLPKGSYTAEEIAPPQG